MKALGIVLSIGLCDTLISKLLWSHVSLRDIHRHDVLRGAL